MENLKIAIVAPCHIPPTDAWINALKAALEGPGKRQAIIIDESPAQDLKFPEGWDVYTRERQKELLGEKKYKFFSEAFHKSSSSRNIGNYAAWFEEYDIIIGLDSDCVVPNGFVGQHIEGLKRQGYGWTNPLQNTGWYPRGYPYQERMRKVVANLGLWEHKLDLNGRDRIANGNDGPEKPMNDKPHQIADGFLSFSGMNWAILREAMPGFLFTPNFSIQEEGNDGEYRLAPILRVDDIWGGYIFQRFMEKRNERVCFGEPVVWHDTVIDAKADSDEEDGSIAYENAFYTAVDLAMEKIEPGTYEDMLLQFSGIVAKDWKDTEFAPLATAYEFWASVFFSDKNGDGLKAA